MQLSRRTLLALGAAVVVAACTDDAGSTPTTGSATSNQPTTSPPPPATSTSSTSTSTSSTTPSSTTTTIAAAQEYDGQTDPFMLGIASGDPDATSVVLWTRLAPQPLTGGGLDAPGYIVRWEVASDREFAQLVGKGDVETTADHTHSLHVIAEDLEPDTVYWYRFLTGEHTSPVGRTKTLPAPDATPARFMLGAASCQDYEEGFYAAHRDVARAGVDALLWLGDYIYEGAARQVEAPGVVRSHGSPEPMDLDGYRNRYARYKSDPDLQAAHASCPWFVMWDDHEVENNYAGIQSEDVSVPDAEFRARRDQAYQAWWEHMPVRLPAPEAGEDYVTYRQAVIGTLAELTMLDERQFRSDQTCGDVTFSLEPACLATIIPDRTMLGPDQEQWFADNIGKHGSTWTVLGNQVVLANLGFENAVLNYDQWDGYPAARDRLLQATADAGASNLVVLTGDIHLSAAADLRRPGGNVLGAEFVTTSVSSTGNVDPSTGALVTFFPDIVDVELDHRGWTLHVITPTEWRAQVRLVDDVTKANSRITPYRTYVVRAGSPGVVREG